MCLTATVVPATADVAEFSVDVSDIEIIEGGTAYVHATFSRPASDSMTLQLVPDYSQPWHVQEVGFGWGRVQVLPGTREVTVPVELPDDRVVDEGEYYYLSAEVNWQPVPGRPGRVTILDDDAGRPEPLNAAVLTADVEEVQVALTYDEPIVCTLTGPLEDYVTATTKHWYMSSPEEVQPRSLDGCDDQNETVVLTFAGDSIVSSGPATLELIQWAGRGSEFVQDLEGNDPADVAIYSPNPILTIDTTLARSYPPQIWISDDVTTGEGTSVKPSFSRDTQNGRVTMEAYEVVGGTATENRDFSWDAWTKSFHIEQDSVDEPDETIVVKMTVASGNTILDDTTVITITDDDPSGMDLTVNPKRLQYGQTAEIAVRVRDGDAPYTRGGTAYLHRWNPAKQWWENLGWTGVPASGEAAFSVTPKVNTRYEVAFHPPLAEPLKVETPLITVEPVVTSSWAVATVDATELAVLRGGTRPRHKGFRVLIDRRVDGEWHRVATATTNDRGRYRYAYDPPRRGKYMFRARLAAHHDHARGLSTPARLTVTR